MAEAAGFCAQPTAAPTDRPTKPSPSGNVNSENHFVTSIDALVPGHSVLTK